MSMSDPDNQILATILNVKAANPERQVVLVSQDINMRVKADSLGIESEDYTNNQIVQKVEEVYSGFVTRTVEDNLIDVFYTGGKVYMKQEEVRLFPNQFVMLVSDINEKKSALCKFKGYDKPLVKVRECKEGVWGIRGKSKEQQFALDLLMDPDIKLVTILGRSGGGKTLLALAAALEQTLETRTYKKIIVSRPVQPMGRDIGFLPGDMKEKLLPWLAPVQDNLEFLMGDSQEDLQSLMEDGTIELEALTYIRGRSIANAIMLIDEFQNLNLHELKTILTRVGENTKIVLTGDINQLDNIFLDSTNNGLTHAVEKFKQYDIAGHVTLQKGERSILATIASEIL